MIITAHDLRVINSTGAPTDRKDIENIEQIAREYLDGISLNQLGRENNISPLTLKAHLVERGIAIRTKTQAAAMAKRLRAQRLN